MFHLQSSRVPDVLSPGRLVFIYAHHPTPETIVPSEHVHPTSIGGPVPQTLGVQSRAAPTVLGRRLAR